MEPIHRNQLLALAVLSILSGTVAYPNLLRDRIPSSSAKRSYNEKIVCFISAANSQFNYGALQAWWCTHYILIDLLVLNSEGHLLIIEQSIPALTQLTEFKARIRQLGDPAKFILAVGGINQDSAHFSQAVQDRGRAYKVAERVVAYAQKYCFDGVDLAWFYPGSFGGCEADKGNLVTLLQELRSRLQGGASLSLTVGVDPQFDRRYNVSQINFYVDFVNIMSGDYHDPEQLSHVSPLYPGDTRDRLNVHFSVIAYMNAGLQREKLVILTSTYGYLYSLRISRQDRHEVVKSVQKLSNLCVRDIIAQENFYTAWDQGRMVPYGTQIRDTTKKWITFNDLESHRKKAEFVQKFHLAGIGVFTLDQDVADERSGGVPFPFLWALVKVLRPNLEFGMIPRIVSDDRKYVQGVKSPQEDGKDGREQYVTDVRYQSAVPKAKHWNLKTNDQNKTHEDVLEQYVRDAVLQSAVEDVPKAKQLSLKANDHSAPEEDILVKYVPDVKKAKQLSLKSNDRNVVKGAVCRRPVITKQATTPESITKTATTEGRTTTTTIEVTNTSTDTDTTNSETTLPEYEIL